MRLPNKSASSIAHEAGKIHTVSASIARSGMSLADFQLCILAADIAAFNTNPAGLIAPVQYRASVMRPEMTPRQFFIN